MKPAQKKHLADGRVISNKEIAADLFEIAVECPPIASAAAPGQFVNVRAWEGTAPLLRRPFSVARVAGTADGTADGGAVVLIVKRVGPGTEILRGLKRGDSLSLVGPLGTGFPPPEKGARYLLVAGGFGIAPLHFFATRAGESGGKILYGARSLGDIPLSIEKFLPKNWKTLYSTLDGSLGKKGLVTGLLEAQLKKGERPDAIYVCGPAAMMKATAAVARKHSLRCLVSMETRMACGIGVCMGCPVPVFDNAKPVYKRACVEGPVFDSAEIRWEEM